MTTKHDDYVPCPEPLTSVYLASAICKYAAAKFGWPDEPAELIRRLDLVSVYQNEAVRVTYDGSPMDPEVRFIVKTLGFRNRIVIVFDRIG